MPLLLDGRLVAVQLAAVILHLLEVVGALGQSIEAGSRDMMLLLVVRPDHAMRREVGESGGIVVHARRQHYTLAQAPWSCSTKKVGVG